MSPDPVAGLIAEANAALVAGDLAGARARARIAACLAPGRAIGWLNEAIAADTQGHSLAARALIDRALVADPADLLSLMVRASLARAARAVAQASEALARAIALAPAIGVIWRELAWTLWGDLAVDPMAQAAGRAVALDPRDPASRHARAYADRHRGAWASARLDAAMVLADTPGHRDGLILTTACLGDLGHSARAIVMADRALRIDPDCAVARLARAGVHLASGDYPRGFADYEARLALETIAPPCGHARRRPTWDGAARPGATLLVRAEQGFGDAIQFCRFAPEAARRGLRVILSVRGRQVALLEGLDGIAAVVAEDRPIPEHDVEIGLHSLPHVLGTRLETLPARVPYLRVEPARRARWRAFVQGLPGLRVGIAWQGNPKFESDIGRSVPLAHWRPLADLPGVSLVALQKFYGLDQIGRADDQALDRFGLTRRDRVDFADRIIVPPDDFDAGEQGFLDTAAVIEALDLIIVSDTSIAHLAGALARPTFIMLKAAPDWRWLRGRTDCPWYPTATLFRQTTPGDWDGVMAAVAGAVVGLTGPMTP